MKTLLKTPFLIAAMIFLSSQAFAFDCERVIGSEYYSVGDSDFQYHYNFKKDGKASLVIYFEELDEQDNEKITSESYEGSFITKGDQLILDIEVRKEKHKVTFQCQNKVNYMNRGVYDQGLIPVKTLPEHHSFSSIPLFKKGSKVIRNTFKK